MNIESLCVTHYCMSLKSKEHLKHSDIYRINDCIHAVKPKHLRLSEEWHYDLENIIFNHPAKVLIKYE